MVPRRQRRTDFSLPPMRRATSATDSPLSSMASAMLSATRPLMSGCCPDTIWADTILSRHDLRRLANFREMAEAHLERLGRAIQRRRNELGWSRSRLGREVNTVEKTVERWEKAQTAGALDHLDQLEDAMDLDRGNLLSAAAKTEERPESPPWAQEIIERLDRIEHALARDRAILQGEGVADDAERLAARRHGGEGSAGPTESPEEGHRGSA